MPRILIVDDDDLTTEYLASVLRELGFDIECANDGREALRHLVSVTFDLLITDLVMPEFEGLELISSAKILYPTLKVIAISGAWEGKFLYSAKLIGADRALAKPISPPELVTAVAEVLGMDY